MSLLLCGGVQTAKCLFGGRWTAGELDKGEACEGIALPLYLSQGVEENRRASTYSNLGQQYPKVNTHLLVSIKRHLHVW